MIWLALVVIVGLAIAASYIFRRDWVAPWRQIENLIGQISKTERPRTFLVQGAPLPRRIGIALEDIYKRQQELAQQLSERASGTETILAAMQDGLLVVDAARHITLANKTFEQYLGVRETLLGGPLSDTVRDPTLNRIVAAALHTGESTRGEIATANRELEVNAVPMKDDASAIIGAVVLFHDITELKRLSEVRKDFVANVSHELRTPLSILRGYIETLRDHPKTSLAERARILQVMERHSKRLGLLVEDLLTLAELESNTPNLQRADVNLHELIARVTRDWEKKLAEKDLAVTVDLAPGLPVIRADETRLQEVLYNLLDNAVKYSNDRGRISLQADQRNGQIALSVSDTGIGISEHDLPRIFERFYRVDKARSSALGGTGLGLSIVKHIAHLHGGSVEAESILGKGTTIRVLLPANPSS